MTDTLADSVDSAANLPYKDTFNLEENEITIALDKV